MNFRITTLLCFLLAALHGNYSFADLNVGHSEDISVINSVTTTTNHTLRVASMGLCTDQLLIQLLAPEQIVAFSDLAKDTTWSFYAKEIIALNKPVSTLETLISLQPDLIVGTHYSRFDEVQVLKKLGMNVKTIELPNAYDDIPAMIRQVGAWTKEKEKAEQLIKQSELKLRKVQRKIAGKKPVNAIIFSPNAFTIGAGTIENDVMKLAGYNNLAAEFGITGFKQISLEKIVINEPDVVLIDNLALNSNSQANKLLSHPVLESISKNNTKPFVPKNMRSCAGTMTTDAIAYLVENR